jgi:hypothetical protein
MFLQHFGMSTGRFNSSLLQCSCKSWDIEINLHSKQQAPSVLRLLGLTHPTNSANKLTRTLYYATFIENSAQLSSAAKPLTTSSAFITPLVVNGDPCLEGTEAHRHCGENVGRSLFYGHWIKLYYPICGWKGVLRRSYT